MAAEDRNGEVVTESECTDCTTRERSFDALARGLANGTFSRRKALWLLGGALVGSALGFTPRAASAEKCKPLAHKCTANVQCCSRYCDKQGQICVCPPQTQIACQGPTGQAKCINICHDPTNPCETSLCDPTTGNCVVSKLTGTPCSDTNPCTLGDTCQNGTCQPGPVRTCGQCLRCNPANGTCEPDANQVGKPCNDSNACTKNDQCTAAGVCAGGEPVDCDDNNPCTIDTCDPTTGCVRTNVANGTPCDDGDPCTIGDTCQNGTCQPGQPLECGQCLTCEGGICVPDTTQNGRGCDDDNPCTTNDTCQSGLCLGTPIPGCVVCTTPADCPVPANSCLQATCVSRVCGVTPKPDGTQCDDENACTRNETCQSGVCIGEPVDCEDNNPCTIDTCDPATGCVHTSVTNGTPCETGNLCTADTCQNGQCTQGPIDVTCGQCLRCNPTTGTCEPDANQVGKPCNDSNACTKNETCTAAGTCVGEPVDCEDNNPCTIDTCDPATGCVHTSVTNGTPCETGNLCTTDTCQNGTCTQGPVNVSCGQCLRCNPATGTCVPDLTKNGTSCNDGNACTTGETCQNGVCAGGTLKSCSACQQCNPVTGNCDRLTGTPCGATGSGRTCCAGTCCGSTETCCSTGPFAGQCKKASGQFCSNNNNCCSQNCFAGICL